MCQQTHEIVEDGVGWVECAVQGQRGEAQSIARDQCVDQVLIDGRRGHVFAVRLAVVEVKRVDIRQYERQQMHNEHVMSIQFLEIREVYS